MKSMYVRLLIIVIMSLSACEKNNGYSEKLIGRWQIESQKQPSIILQISKNTISRFENQKEMIYSSYAFSGDTLIMVRGKFTEKHIIEVLTDTKLRLGAIHPYDKDIELIDAVEFVKK